MTSLINGALQPRQIVFPAEDLELEDQFTTHTYTLRDGRVVYSKGEGEETVSLVRLTTEPVFI